MDDFILRNWPRTIDEVVLGTKQLRESLELLAKSDLSSPVLLVGSEGVGKFTLATVLARRENGIIIYRDEFLSGTEVRFIKKINKLAAKNDDSTYEGIINHVDLYKKSEQVRIVEGLEVRTNNSKKLVFTATDISMVNPGIVSQCRIIRVNKPPNGCWINRVATILEMEGFDRLTGNQCLSIIRQGRGAAKGIMRELFDLCEKFK